MFRDFQLVRDVFTLGEQKTLLAACLQKLDAMDGSSVRRKRRKFLLSARPRQDGSVMDVFCPDEYYAFELVRFRISVP